MNIQLSPEEKQELEVRHNQEKNHRKADRIKSVLLRVVTKYASPIQYE